MAASCGGRQRDGRIVGGVDGTVVMRCLGMPALVRAVGRRLDVGCRGEYHIPVRVGLGQPRGGGV